jgi:HK97 family phage prohead protease
MLPPDAAVTASAPMVDTTTGDGTLMPNADGGPANAEDEGLCTACMSRPQVAGPTQFCDSCGTALDMDTDPAALNAADAQGVAAADAAPSAADPDAGSEYVGDSMRSETRAAKYSAEQLRQMLAKGEAFKNANGDPSFPIADREDLENAIHAVGRASASGNAVRRYIIGRAKALNLSSLIPDTWNADGSLQRSKVRAGESVVRSLDLAPTGDSDGRTLEGYAAVFEEATEIDSWEGHFRETIQRGAFAKTLAEHKPALLFDHGRHPQIGAMPIGTITDLREDSRGLFVKARLTDSSLVEPVRAAIADGSIPGMSVRMNVVKDAWSAGVGNIAERSIKEVGLVELGPVVFPAYDSTEVAVRSRTENRAGATDDTSAGATPNEPDGAADHSFDAIRSRARALLILGD